MANNITKDLFLIYFDEFKGVPSPKIEAYIGIASGRVAPGVWGDNTAFATALLTAHLLASGGGAGGTGGAAGGVLTSESVGELSRGFSPIVVAESGDAPYQTTHYGIQYLALRRETVIGVCATGPTPIQGCP